MTLKRKLAGGILATLGFMLSPLSWWNDAFVNLPLALAFAWLASSRAAPEIRERVFQISLVAAYWLTNVLGFVLMYKGVRWMRSPGVKSETRRELWQDVWISLGYTALLVALLKLGVLKSIEGYFPRS